MTTVKIGDRELNIKYAYKVTAKSGLITKLVALESDMQSAEGFEKINCLMDILPEMLLQGLQKFHADEFGYNIDNDEGKAEAFDKVYGLLDEYFDDETSDFGELYGKLQNELLANGFLASIFRAAQTEQKSKRARK